ncbi:MAG: hypothetical protein LBC75_11430 [Fibromonadaceae bacterium]|nr:hypothetical protein [Fibromonadaceae bacterium]
MQTISCSIGTIEVIPESTKLSMQNNSSVKLLSVKWNGTDFGNINLGESSEMIVSHGEGPIYFSVSNGKQYRTQAYVLGKKYEHTKFPFIDNTRVIDVDTKNASILGDILNVD